MKKAKRLLSLILAVILCVGLLPMQAMAGDVGVAAATTKPDLDVASNAYVKATITSYSDSNRKTELTGLGAKTELDNIGGALSILRANNSSNLYATVTIEGWVENTAVGDDSILSFEVEATNGRGEWKTYTTAISVSEDPMTPSLKWTITWDVDDSTPLKAYRVKLVTANGAERIVYYTLTEHVKATGNLRYRTAGINVETISNDEDTVYIPANSLIVPLIDAEYLSDESLEEVIDALKKNAADDATAKRMLESGKAITISGSRVVAARDGNEVLDYYDTYQYSSNGGTKLSEDDFTSAQFGKALGTGADTLKGVPAKYSGNPNANWDTTTASVFANYTMTLSFEVPAILSVKSNYYYQTWNPEKVNKDGELGDYDTELIMTLSYTINDGTSSMECYPYQTIQFTVNNTDAGLTPSENFKYHGLRYRDPDNQEPVAGEKDTASKTFLLSGTKQWGEVDFYWRDDTLKDTGIQVYTKDQDGTPIDGADVTGTNLPSLKTGAHPTDPAITGYAEWPDAEAGEYTIAGSYQPTIYSTDSKDIVLEEDELEVVELTLKYTKLNIIVKTPEGTPVPDATYTVTTGSGTEVEKGDTDASGTATVTKIPADTYTVKAEKDDEEASETIEIEPGEEVTVELILDVDVKTGDIIVKVVEKGTSTPISGATVTAPTISDTALTTDATGQCVYTDVPVGETYEIYGSKDGYGGGSTTATPVEDESITVTIELSRVLDDAKPQKIEVYPENLDLEAVKFASDNKFIAGCDVYIGVYFKGNRENGDFTNVDCSLEIRKEDDRTVITTLYTNTVAKGNGAENIAIFRWDDVPSNINGGKMYFTVDSSNNYDEKDEWQKTTHTFDCTFTGDCDNPMPTIELTSWAAATSPVEEPTHTHSTGYSYNYKSSVYGCGSCGGTSSRGGSHMCGEGEDAKTRIYSHWYSIYDCSYLGCSATTSNRSSLHYHDVEYVCEYLVPDGTKHDYGMPYGHAFTYNNKISAPFVITSEPKTSTETKINETTNPPTPSTTHDKPGTKELTWIEYVYENGNIVPKTCKVTLTVDADVDYQTEVEGNEKKSYIRSGYGYEMNLDTKVKGTNTTDFTPVQLAYAYVPHFKDGYTRPIKLITGNSSSNRLYTFEKNTEESVYNNPKQFIPVWWPDTKVKSNGEIQTDNYVVQSYATAVYTPVGMLSAWGDDQSLKIEGSMYDDDTVLIQ